MAWEPPESDGNAPIIKYVVERREKSEKNWLTVGEVPAEEERKVTDEKVVEGQEYYYRVKAVNKAGPGDPCDYTRPGVLVKAKPGLCSMASLPTLISHSLNRFIFKLNANLS